MNDTKFKGKRVEDGEWVYGDRIRTTDGTYIANIHSISNEGAVLMPNGEVGYIVTGNLYIRGVDTMFGMCKIINLETGSITEVSVSALVRPVKARVIIESEE